MSGFHGAFATAVACQQGTLTLPDTWFRSHFWDLLVLQLLRPDSSNLPCLYTTFHLEYPWYFLDFASADGSTVAFTAYASTGKTTYTSEVVIFNEIITNQGGAYSKSTGIFTCPTEGVYAFTWTHLIHAGNYCHAYLYKNGAQQNLDAHSNLQGMSSTSVVYTMASMSGTLHLSRGDHVWIHSTHCESFMNTPYNSFSGWKL